MEAHQRAQRPVSAAAPSEDDELTQLRARVAELESELAVRSMHLDFATDGVWDWDLKTNYEYMSPRFWRTFGYDPDDFPHHASAWQDIIHPDDRDLALKMFEEHTQQGKEYRLPVRYRHKDGHWVWVVCRGQALKNEAGEYYRMLGAHQDITELKRNEEALQQARRQFRETLLRAPIGIALVAPDGKWLSVNRALCDIVGYTESEMLQLTFQDITHVEDLDADLENVQRMLEGKLDTYQMEKRYIHRDGQIIWVQLNVSLLRDAEGEPVHFISQIQDITAAKQHLERVEQLNRELRQLLDAFTHDLNEPVRKLAVHAARMREALRTRDPDRAMRSIEVLEAESGRLGEIHDGLQEYLRFATRALRHEEIDLQALFSHEASRLRTRIKALEAHLVVEPLPRVHADRAMISTVLHNLLDNALKFSRPGVSPSIRVVSEKSEDRKFVRICIEDNGIGIVESHKESALRIFHRLSGRNKSTDPGVGLAVCQKIIERHGGQLELTPNTEKPGLTVAVTLPVALSL